MRIRLISASIIGALWFVLPGSVLAIDLSALEKAQKANEAAQEAQRAAAAASAARAATQIQHVPQAAPQVPQAQQVPRNNGYVPQQTMPRPQANAGQSYTPHPTNSGTTYTPHPSTNAGTTYTPHPSTNAGTTYTPHANTSSGTTYTPHASSNTSGETTYTPHASVGGASGVTTYTPHAATASSGASTSTPHASGGATTTYSPHVAASTGGSTGGETAVPTTGAAIRTGAQGSSKPASPAPVHSVYSAPATSAVASKAAAGTTLTREGSQSVLSQVNTARAGMKGINVKPLPAGTVTTHSNGGLTVKTDKGTQLGVRANGTLASYKADGVAASFRSNGKVASIRTASMDIQHGTNGQRTIVSHLANHNTLVNTGRHSGYLEHPVEHGGHSFIERRYVVGDHRFVRVFAPYTLHGAALAAYVTASYFAPAYYGWAYAPWAAPAPYAWGWVGAPWYGYYHGYFAPYPAYAGPADWLTDYALADTLSEGYNEQQDGIADDADGDGTGVQYSDAPPQDELAATEATPITPELKDAIAEQVREQLAEQQTAAAAPVAETYVPQASAPASTAPAKTAVAATAPTAGLQKALRPNHVFVVSTSMDASTVDQQVCGLTHGDVLQMKTAPAANDPLATLRVASSKRTDCPAGTLVQLSLQDVQDMQNDFAARVDSGLAALHDSQGKNGLPAAPADALAAVSRPGLAGDLGNDDANVQALLDAQRQQANLTEKQVTQGAFYN